MQNEEAVANSLQSGLGKTGLRDLKPYHGVFD
jgi:hypothetical protein